MTNNAYVYQSNTWWCLLLKKISILIIRQNWFPKLQNYKSSVFQFSQSFSFHHCPFDTKITLTLYTFYKLNPCVGTVLCKNCTTFCYVLSWRARISGGTPLVHLWDFTCNNIAGWINHINRYVFFKKKKKKRLDQ